MMLQSTSHVNIFKMQPLHFVLSFYIFTPKHNQNTQNTVHILSRCPSQGYKYSNTGFCGTDAAIQQFRILYKISHLLTHTLSCKFDWMHQLAMLCYELRHCIWQFILLEVYIYPSPSTNFGILYVKEGIAMMTDILQQKHDTVYTVQQITRLMEKRVYDVHQV